MADESPAELRRRRFARISSRSSRTRCGARSRPSSARPGRSRGAGRTCRTTSASTFLGLIVGEANRLASLVSDMSDVSRIDSGFFGYTFAEVDVSALVRAAVCTAAAAPVRGRGRRASARRPAGRSSRRRAAAAGAREPDRQRGQVLAARRPRSATSRSRSTEADGRVSIAVTDHGGGIAPEDQARDLREVRPGSRPRCEAGHGARPLHRARRSRRRTAGRSRSRRVPGRTTFTLTLPAA